MALRKKKKGDAQVVQVPMSSMIDVVFLLLIYFIVTQKDEIQEAHLAVNLPAPSAPSKPEEKPTLLELEVHPGRIMLQGVVRPPEMIKETLAYLAKLDSDQTVIVKTNVMARTAELVTALDLCKGVGFTKLNVVTLK